MELLVLLTIFLGLLFDYTNGFHDAANVVSTVIATKVLRPLSAILMASCLNFLGATQISGVAQTIAQGLVEASSTVEEVVVASLIGAILWNFLTWYKGIPSSSSYALIGGLLGAAWAQGGKEQIFWDGVLYKVLLPMVASPILGFFLGWGFMKGVFFLVTKRPDAANRRIFRHLQIVSAAFVALSHGMNDAQKSMGILTLGLFSAKWIATPEIPLWVILSCALVMGLGTASGGFRIIKTMGFSITKMEPMQGFAAESTSSLIILGASMFGMPVSSTHVIAGGITGVGTAKSPRAVSWEVPQKLALAWIWTLPGSALLSVVSYWILQRS